MSAISFEASESMVYVYGMYAYGAISTICFGIAFWTIFYHSPLAFGYYKYFLLNIAICAYMFDCYMCIIYQPKVLMPALALCPNGLIRSNSDVIAGIAQCFLLFLLGCNIVSVLSAFIYRFGLLHNHSKTITSQKFTIFIVALHLFYCSPTITGYIMAIKESKTGRELLYHDYPHIEPHISNLGCSFTKLTDPIMKYFLMPLSAILYSGSFPLIMFLIAKSFSALKKQRYEMSVKTYEMHRQLLFSLIFQLAVPSCSLFIPAAILMILLALGAQDIVVITQIIYVLCSSHTFFNTFMMMYFIKPYRRRLLSLLGKGAITLSNPHVFKTKISVIHNSSSKIINVQ